MGVCVFCGVGVSVCQYLSSRTGLDGAGFVFLYKNNTVSPPENKTYFNKNKSSVSGICIGNVSPTRTVSVSPDGFTIVTYELCGAT